MSHKGNPFPSSLAFLLNNPIRRWIQPPSELVEKLEIKPEDVVVDYGCGPGYYTIEIAKKAKSTVAVDISPEMLKKAQKAAAKARVDNIRFLQNDGKNLLLEDRSVDMIVLVTVFHEIEESEVALKEYGRVLKKDGRLVIVEIIKKGIFPGAPVQNPDALKAEIEAVSFKLERMLPYRSYGIFFFGNP